MVLLAEIGDIYLAKNNVAKKCHISNDRWVLVLIRSTSGLQFSL